MEKKIFTEILVYLLSLDEEDKQFVIQFMLDKANETVHTDGVDPCCPLPKPTGSGSTTYGYWECNRQTCKWYWIPELG